MQGRVKAVDIPDTPGPTQPAASSRSQHRGVTYGQALLSMIPRPDMCPPRTPPPAVSASCLTLFCGTETREALPASNLAPVQILFRSTEPAPCARTSTLGSVESRSLPPFGENRGGHGDDDSSETLGMDTKLGDSAISNRDFHGCIEFLNFGYACRGRVACRRCCICSERRLIHWPGVHLRLRGREMPEKHRSGAGGLLLSHSAAAGHRSSDEDEAITS